MTENKTDSKSKPQKRVRTVARSAKPTTDRTKTTTAKATRTKAGTSSKKTLASTRSKPQTEKPTAKPKTPAAQNRATATKTSAKTASSKTALTKARRANVKTTTAKSSSTKAKPKIEKPTAKPKESAKVKPNSTRERTTPPTTHAIPTPTSSLSISSEISGSFGSVVFKPYKLRKREGHMTRRQQNHFLNILTQWRDALTSSVETETTTEHEKSKNLPDPVDQGTKESVFHSQLRARDRDRQLISKIVGAIGKIKSGDYGYCETCGVAIGIRRLEARPIATQCVDCKQRDEIREKQLGR